MNFLENLPDDWDLLKISDVTQKAKNGGTPKKSESSYWGGDIGWLNSGDVRGKYTSEPSKYITEKAIEETSAKIFEEGSVLVAMYGGKGTIGRATILSKPLSGNQAICALEVNKSKITTEFLYYYINQIRGHLEDIARGGAQSNINQQMLLEQKIPVPPLDEQERIVREIENRLDTVNTLETSVNNLQQYSEEYEESYISALITGQNLNTTIQNFLSRSHIPDGWGLKKLEDVATVNPRLSIDDETEQAYVPMDAVSSETQSITRFETKDNIYSGLAKFKEGDIIIAKITPCFENGKMAIVNDIPDNYDVAVGSSEFVVIQSENINRDYLFTFLKSPIVKKWGENRLIGSTNRERINVSQFRDELEVPIPPIETQKQIVNLYQNINFDELHKSINTLNVLFDEMEKSVLHHAFSGELV